MAKENRVEYERVDEKGDEYRRILVKFNPHFLRGSDFEIEFIPLLESYDYGKIFVTEIDSMSTIDLYRWADREKCLTDGVGKLDAGTIIPKKVNLKRAKVMKAAYRQGKIGLEPRQVISRIKRIYEFVEKEFSEPTAFALNYFLFCGRLGSLPFVNEDFSIEKLKIAIDDVPYTCKSSDGELVMHSLVWHLFDVHKTKNVTNAILNFLGAMREMMQEIIEEYDAKHR